MLPIVTAPNSVLSTVAEPIKKVDKDILNLIEEMKQTLLNATDPQGVGLAAPQVGKSLQLFLAKPTQKSPFLVFINPKIISASEEKDYLNRLASLRSGPKKPKKPAKLEGCLSLQNIWGTVLRNKNVTIQYQLLTTNYELITKTEVFDGFMSTIIQHEMDHLQGILFPKRVLEQNGTLYKSHKNDKGEDEFDPLEI